MQKSLKPLRILLFSSLYPSEVRPIHGIFVETRLRELLKTGQVQAKVVAPVPWFPLKSPRFGEYASSRPRRAWSSATGWKCTTHVTCCCPRSA